MAAQYYNELLSYFSRAMKDREAAADIVQEAYVRLVALQRTGEAVSNVRALLYRTARNLIIDRHRHLQVQGLMPSGSEDAVEVLPAHRASEPDARLASLQSLQAVLATIDGLPLRCREAFVLCRFDGLSQAEAAQRMGISRKAVEQHVRNAMLAIHRCREQLDAGASAALPALRRQASEG